MPFGVGLGVGGVFGEVGQAAFLRRASRECVLMDAEGRDQDGQHRQAESGMA